MNLITFYDLETTGLPMFSKPSEDPRQPHIVQLAAVLIDVDTRKHVSSMNVIVRPDGWVIPEDVSSIHGITTEIASDVGVSESMALGMFLSLWGEGKAIQRVRVAHNESFDARIIRIAALRYEDADLADQWKAARAECTARMSTPLCALPPTAKMRAAGRNHHKTPNLGEAYKYFTGRDLEGAHDAMVDVLACVDIYFGIIDRKEK